MVGQVVGLGGAVRLGPHLLPDGRRVEVVHLVSATPGEPTGEVGYVLDGRRVYVSGEEWAKMGATRDEPAPSLLGPRVA